MSTRQILVLLVKLVVTAVLIAFILRSIDTAELWRAFSRIDLLSACVATVLVALQAGLLSWRWHRIVHHLGGALKLRSALLWTMVGIFFNQALPSSVGGDAVRVWMLRRDGSPNRLAFGSVLVERVSGLVVLGALVSLAALSLTVGVGGHAALQPLLFVGPVILAGTVSLLLLGAAFARVLPSRAADSVTLLIAAFSSVWRSPAAAVEAFALGAAASTTGLLAAWVLGHSLGIDAGAPAYIALVGGAVLLTVLPISFGGWGLREAGVVALFAVIGAPREPVLAMSLAWGLLPVLVSTPFAAVWWLSRRRGDTPISAP